MKLPAALRIEVNAFTQERALPARPSLEQVSVTCGDAARVRVEIVFSQGRTASVDLDQSEVALEARTRALALSVVELVDTFWASVSASQKPKKAPWVSAPVGTVEIVRPTLRARRGRTLLLGPVVERVGQPKSWLYGAELALEWPLGSLVTPVLAWRGQAGISGNDNMPVRITSWSGAAYVLFGTGTEQWHLNIGPGARAGVVSLAGDASQSPLVRGYSLTAPWGGFGLRATASHRLAALRVSVAADLGIVTHAVAGTLDGSNREYALDGLWFGLLVAAGTDF